MTLKGTEGILTSAPSISAVSKTYKLLLTLVSTGIPLSAKQLASVAGKLLWISAPALRSFPFMAGLYPLTSRSKAVVSPALFQRIVQGMFVALKGCDLGGPAALLKHRPSTIMNSFTLPSPMCQLQHFLFSRLSSSLLMVIPTPKQLPWLWFILLALDLL